MAKAPAQLVYYDASGNRLSEPVSGGWQYRSDDPLRPDSGVEPSALFSAMPPAQEPDDDDQDEEKAVAKPAANKARKSSANK